MQSSTEFEMSTARPLIKVDEKTAVQPGIASRDLSNLGPLPAAAIPPEPRPLSEELFLNHFRAGAKPRPQWMCGIEFEVFGYDPGRDFARITPAQVQQVLRHMAAPEDLIFEGQDLVETLSGHEGSRITIEPGGQIEFSGAPHRSLARIEQDLNQFTSSLGTTGNDLGLFFASVGFDPLRTREEQEWFSKSRYQVMRPFLGSRGSRSWDMMSRTCALQVSLDYDSEEDLVAKFLAGNRLAPIITAIFANSPFENGKLSGYKSTRAAVWLDTDPERTSIPPAALNGNFSVHSFIEYALNTPMIFVRRDNYCQSLPGRVTFSDFLSGTTGFQPFPCDWTDHLTTIFTDARLKQSIELRSADGNSVSMALAEAALWKGLLYDRDSLERALQLAPALNMPESLALRHAVARDGLRAVCAGVKVAILAKDLVSLAREGLGRIAPEESCSLEPLIEIVAEEMSPADILIKNWNGSWHGSMARVLEHLRSS